MRAQADSTRRHARPAHSDAAACHPPYFELSEATMRALLLSLSVITVAAVAYFALSSGSASREPGEGAVAGAGPLHAGPTEALTAAELAAVENRAAEVRRAASGAEPSEVAPTSSTTDAAAPAATAVVKGRVLDSFGRPINGADVQRDELRFGSFSFTRTGPKPAVERTKTGPDGRFELPANGGDVRLRFGSDGNEWLRRSVAVAADGVTDIGDVQLAVGIRLAGRVVDARGNPVADARIAKPSDQDGLVVMIGFEEQDEELTRTRTDGTFEVVRHPAGSWKLAVTHPKFPRATAQGDELRAGERHDGILIELADGVTLAGTVSDLPSDRSGLVVRARPVQTRSEGGGLVSMTFGSDLEELGGGGRSVAIHADGTFELAGLPRAESYRVGVYERSAGPFGGGRRSTQATAAAGARNVQLVHGSGATVTLRVVDAVTKLPVESFGVNAGFGWPRPIVSPDGKPLKLHPGGVVRLENQWADGPGDSLQVELEATGYTTWRRTDIEAPAGAFVDLGVIELMPRPTVEVRVTDAVGAPLVDAHVVLSEVKDDTGGERSFGIRRRIEATATAGEPAHEDSSVVTHGIDREDGRTDAQGIARLNSLPGKRARITVTARGFAEWTSDALALPKTTGSSVEAVLSRGGVVVVTVVDGRGLPVAGARVERRQPSGMGFVPQPDEDRGRRSQVTDGAGVARFDFVGLGAQGFRLGAKRPSGGMVISLEGFGESDGEQWSEVEVVEGGEHELTLIQPARATLVGTIHEDGKPLGGARVNQFTPGGLGEELAFLGGGSAVTTDGAGRFRMEELDLGQLTIEVRHKGRAMPMRFEVQLGEGENEARFDLPVSVVEGRVTDPEGQPVQGAEVKAKRPVAPREGPQRVAVMVSAVASGGSDGESMSISTVGTPETKVLTDEDGRYSLRGVTPDVPIVVEVTKRGFRDTQSKEFTVAAGATRSQVDVTVDAGGAIEVTCAESGNWMAMARLVEEGAPPGEPKVEMLQNGKAKLKDLAPGTWTVSVRPLGPPGEVAPFDEQTVVVKSQETAQLTFER
jgi:protocatechuate 3,4-dioxygenase beta subunit